MYYNLKKILNENCQYNLIIGVPRIGKTYTILKYGLEKYIKGGEQMAYIRRTSKEIQGSLLFAVLAHRGEIEKMTNGEYNAVYYYSSRWYLCRIIDGERIKTDEKPFCFGFSIASVDYATIEYFPNISTICFDEFLTNKYLPNEFNRFMHLIYNISQNRDNVKIFMLANPVDCFSPYFSKMGITNIKNMNQGDIALSTYGKSQLKIAVEICER